MSEMKKKSTDSKSSIVPKLDLNNLEDKQKAAIRLQLEQEKFKKKYLLKSIPYAQTKSEPQFASSGTDHTKSKKTSVKTNGSSMI